MTPQMPPARRHSSFRTPYSPPQEKRVTAAAAVAFVILLCQPSGHPAAATTEKEPLKLSMPKITLPGAHAQGPTNMLVVRGNWPRELPIVRALPLMDGPKHRVTAMCLTPLGGNDRLLVRFLPCVVSAAGRGSEPRVSVPH